MNAGELRTDQLVFHDNGFLGAADAQRIVDAGVRVLRQVGFTIEGTDEFLDCLRAYGCRIDATHVTFPDAVIDKLLSLIAGEREVNQSAEYQPSDKLTFYASGQGSLWTAPEDDRTRSGTRADLAAYSRMLDALEVPRAHPSIIPSDVPRATADLHAFATIAMNSSRPWRVSPYSPGIIQYFLDVMTVITGSREEAVRQAPFAHKLWISSPFKIAREAVEGAMTSRKLLGHTINITIMPVSGVSAPVTAAGAIVQEVAEVLGANVISLAINGSLAGYCSSTLCFDMTDNVSVEMGPDADIRRLLGAAVAQHWFGYRRPPSGIGLRSSAPVPGAQSMMEKSMVTIEVMRGGRDFMAAGTLSHCDTVSPVQLLLDLELRDYLQALIKPVDLSDEALAEDVILSVAPTGARYLESEHTLRRYRDELWFPKLVRRAAAKSYMDNPHDMLDRARARALELLANSPNRCPLDSAQRSEIERICAAADREFS